MKIGKLLKIYLDINEMGYRDLAKEIGVSHTTIARIIDGKDVATDSFLKLINWLFK